MTRSETMKLALLPFAKVANSDPAAMLAAGVAAVPDADPGEIIDAFEELATDLAQEASALRGELRARDGAI